MSQILGCKVLGFSAGRIGVHVVWLRPRSANHAPRWQLAGWSCQDC